MPCSDRFIAAGIRIAPDATGTAIGIQASGRAVVGAFIEAGVLSFVAITALLLFALRRVRDVAITMAPIVLTGLLTLGTCVLIGQPLNFANIIALPLLFGIGVAFHIYFVMSWRVGRLAPADIEPGARGLLQRARHRDRLRQPLGFQPSWNRQHGQAPDDLPGLDPGLGAALPTGADGPTAVKSEQSFHCFIEFVAELVQMGYQALEPHRRLSRRRNLIAAMSVR